MRLQHKRVWFMILVAYWALPIPLNIYRRYHLKKKCLKTSAGFVYYIERLLGPVSIIFHSGIFNSL